MQGFADYERKEDHIPSPRSDKQNGALSSRTDIVSFGHNKSK